MQLDCVGRCIRELGVNAVVIVDIIHVIEYLWGAANAFFGEGANEAEAWVNERLYRVLCQRPRYQIAPGSPNQIAVRVTQPDRARVTQPDPDRPPPR